VEGSASKANYWKNAASKWLSREASRVRLATLMQCCEQLQRPYICSAPAVVDFILPQFVSRRCTGAQMSWASKLIKPYRIDDGTRFRLKDFDPADTGQINSKEQAEQLLTQGIASMSVLQEKLYAQDCWGVLLIFQAMDAAGKDGAIKHVMSGVNPQGVQVYSFKTPSSEELNHDYLWRTMQYVPQRGRIGIFNRSYYEEVLVVRVHPDLLKSERTPPSLLSENIWKDRFQDINSFERYLSRNGIVVRKFFLNLSKKEQKRRFLDRLDHPEKNWKFSAADVQEREHWDDYMKAYEDMIIHTASKHSPWYVLPADNKWFTRLAVAAAIVDTLEDLKVAYPKVGREKQKELQTARALLEGKKKT
jgi:PPK2 family polyphosphate:nucleotide phosphotransferase